MTEQIPDITNPETWTDRPKCDDCGNVFGYGDSWLIDMDTFKMSCGVCNKKEKSE